jgi:hypothetical protein
MVPEIVITAATKPVLTQYVNFLVFILTSSLARGKTSGLRDL